MDHIADMMTGNVENMPIKDALGISDYAPDAANYDNEKNESTGFKIVNNSGVHSYEIIGFVKQDDMDDDIVDISEVITDTAETLDVALDDKGFQS